MVLLGEMPQVKSNEQRRRSGVLLKIIVLLKNYFGNIWRILFLKRRRLHLNAHL